LNILLHLGENGSVFINKHTEIFMPVIWKFNPKILNDYKIVDTTGAGDCFTSSFFVKYMELTNGGELL